METTTVTVRAAPDALVKIYDENRDEVLYIDNTDEDGTTPPIALPLSGNYFVDVTVFAKEKWPELQVIFFITFVVEFNFPHRSLQRRQLWHFPIVF